MTMVNETRRIVEDYILYKINSSHAFVEPTNSSQPRMFPLPQDPPSDVNSAIRSIANQYEERYKASFPDLLEGIRANHLATSDIDRVFSRITKDLFKLSENGHTAVTSSPSGGRKNRNPVTTVNGGMAPGKSIETVNDKNIKWGHVIGLLVFSGMMAVRCVEINCSEKVDTIVNWVTNFLDTKLAYWLKTQGGWSGFASWYQDGSSSQADNWFDQLQQDGIKTALRVGAVAAFIGFGAMMMARK